MDREKVINGLETCGISGTREDCEGYGCPYFIYNDEVSDECQVTLFRDALALLKALNAFKSYFDGLYGQGLDVANYHLNGATEPFDSFYDSAMEEYENGRKAV
jgi:hypothetical protein